MSRSAHPAGPRHADVLTEGHYSAPPADLNALDPKVWAHTVSRRTTESCQVVDGSDQARRRVRHPRLLPRRDRLPARARPAPGGPPSGTTPTSSTPGRPSSRAPSCGGCTRRGSTSTCAPAVSSPPPSPPGCPPTASPSTATTSPRKRSPPPSCSGSGGSFSTSSRQIVRVAHIARSLGKRQRVQIRVTVGVEAHTHEFIATAHEDQKFGIALADGEAAEAVRRALALDGRSSWASTRTSVRRSSTWPGSRSPPGGWCRCWPPFVTSTGSSCPRSTSVVVSRIAYTSDDDPRAARDREGAGRDRHAGVPGREAATPRISVEPGGPSSAPTAFTLYEVGTIKPLDGLRTYVSVDGGMSDNIRTALYDAEYSVALVSRTSDAEPMLVRVVGKHCESGDIVVKDAFLSTWPPATSSPYPPRVPTAGPWPATTTTPCARRSSPCATARPWSSSAGRRRRTSWPARRRMTGRSGEERPWLVGGTTVAGGGRNDRLIEVGNEWSAQVEDLLPPPVGKMK